MRLPGCAGVGDYGPGVSRERRTVRMSSVIVLDGR